MMLKHQILLDFCILAQSVMSSLLHEYYQPTNSLHYRVNQQIS
jgi:hypothetical protein